MAAPTTELNRLGQYNAGIYNASTNPYGMDGYGYATNLPLLASDAATVANYLSTELAPLAGMAEEVGQIAGIATEIDTLAAQSANLTTLAALSSQISTLAGIAANITAAVSNAANITAVAGNATNINNVASNATNVNNVAAALSNINAVAAALSNITTVLAMTANINTVAGANAAIGTVATNISNVNTVAGANSNISTVAGIAANVTAVAGVASEFANVVAHASDIETVGDNITAVQSASNNMAAILAAPTHAANAASAASAAQLAEQGAKRTALFLEFDAGTADANPGTGAFRLNNASPNAATVLFVSNSAASAGDIGDWVDTWDDSSNPGNRGELTLIDAANAANWLKLIVTGANVTATGYRKVAVSYVDHNGSFSDGALFSVEFSRSGNIGASGAGTGTVQTTGTVEDGRLSIFDGTTGDFIKDSGKSVSDFATAAQGALAASALQPTAVGVTVQPYDADLAAIAGLTSAANKVLYATGSGTWALADFTSAARALLDDADAATMRTTLGLVIGTNVMAYDADLAAIAGLTSAANKGIYFTGAGTAGTYDLTAAGRTLLAAVDADAQRVALGLGTAATASTGDFAPASHVGAGGAAHSVAVASGAAGFMTGADKAKLDGIASGATANATDAQLRDRATHTGEQAIATVTGLQTALDAKANSSSLGSSAAMNKATDAEVRAAVADKVLTADLLETAVAIVTLTDATTIAVDWDAFLVAQVTMAGSRTLGNPTNVQPGTTRYIVIKGSSSTARTLSFAANYKGDLPTDTVTSAIWMLIGLTAITATHIVVTSCKAL